MIGHASTVKRALLFGATALVSSYASVAMAQATPVTPPPAAGSASLASGNAAQSFELGEIVVTAQKREEKLNDVGMAITAATGSTLAARNITNVAGLTRIEPSLQFTEGLNGAPVYSIRGVGFFEQSLSAASTVSIYQDEVAYTYPVMSKGALLDVQRVEILKGPQGTLYGQNATGGAVNFIAARPTSEFTAGVDATYARFNAVDLSGFISGPLTPTLTARLAAKIQEGGAWQKSMTRPDTLGNKDNKFARLLLDWKPSENFTARLNLNAWADDSDVQAYQLEGFSFQNPFSISAVNPSFRPVQPYSQYPAPIQALIASPIAPDNARAADWQAGTHPHNHEIFYQGALRLDYSFSDAISLTSLTNYQKFTKADQVDIGAVAVPQIYVYPTGDVDSISQELRLHGVVAEGHLNWLVGANYDRTNTNEDSPAAMLFSNSYLSAGTPYGLWRGYHALNYARANTASVFANLDFKILDNLSINGGIRYTDSRQNLSNCATVNNQGVVDILNSISTAIGGQGIGKLNECITLNKAGNSGLINNELDQTNVPWRVGVDWKVTPLTLTYFSVSKGFKAGSAPAVGGSIYPTFNPVSQESLLAYEAGFKSTLFERTLHIDLSIFHYDYTDKQFLGRIVDPLGVFGLQQGLVNVPKSEVDGAELAAVWTPVRGLTLNAAATYLDSRVESNFINYSNFATGPTDTINLKGESFPFTPKWSLQYGVRYARPLNEAFSAFVSADCSYQSSTVSAFGAKAVNSASLPLDIKSYALLNLAAGVESTDQKWRVEIWGKNVTNEYYWTTVNRAADTTWRGAGMPATYGISLAYRYH